MSTKPLIDFLLLIFEILAALRAVQTTSAALRAVLTSFAALRAAFGDFTRGSLRDPRPASQLTPETSAPSAPWEKKQYS